MRLELQSSRNELTRFKSERDEERKEFGKQLQQSQNQYVKLQREFKRTVDKLNKQINDQKFESSRLLESYNELQKYVYNSTPNSAPPKKISSDGIKNKHLQTDNNGRVASKSRTPPTISDSDHPNAQEDLDSQEVIFF